MYNFFGLKGNTREDIVISTDIADFNKSVSKYFGFEEFDNVELTPYLKPVLLDNDKFIEFCNYIEYQPSVAIQLMVIARYDVLFEPRVISRLKQLVLKYDLTPTGVMK